MFTRTFDLLEYRKDYYKKWGVFYYEDGCNESCVTMELLIKNADIISGFLLFKGINKGDIVVTLSINTPEFNYFDFGIMQIGAIHVPVSPFLKEDELKLILEETDAKVFFVSHKLLFQKFKTIIEGSKLKPLIILGESNNNYTSFQEILSGTIFFDYSAELLKRKLSVDPREIASILYTTGSTGSPKGVMISHFNMTQAISIMTPYFYLSQGFKIISYIPINVGYERFMQYVSIYSGMSIYYKNNNESLQESLLRIKPDVMVATPLVLEKFYNNFIFEIGKDVPLKIKKKKLEQFFGGRLRKIFCSGATFSEEINHFYWDMNMPVYELYGASEFFGTIAINTEKDYKLGTVGKIIKNFDVKIRNDGELKIKGPSLTKGYFKSPELTKSKIDKYGWFATGDVVKLDNEGFLKVVGRKTDIFKLKSGIYFNPVSIENKFKVNNLIKNILIVGENKPFISAIIVPDKDVLLRLASNNGIDSSNYKWLLKNEFILKEFDNLIEDYNNNCHETENIRRYELIEKEFSVEGGELTSLFKIKRKVILKKYKKTITSFYEK